MQESISRASQIFRKIRCIESLLSYPKMGEEYPCLFFEIQSFRYRYFFYRINSLDFKQE